jgi:FkbM family methyltransferase
MAIAASSGKLSFHLSVNTEASSILDSSLSGKYETIEAQAICLDEFLNLAGLHHVDLIKFDIEGAEIEVLDSCADEFLMGVQQLSIEFHDGLDKYLLAQSNRGSTLNSPLLPK